MLIVILYTGLALSENLCVCVCVVVDWLMDTHMRMDMYVCVHIGVWK